MCLSTVDLLPPIPCLPWEALFEKLVPVEHFGIEITFSHYHFLFTNTAVDARQSLFRQMSSCLRRIRFFFPGASQILPASRFMRSGISPFEFILFESSLRLNHVCFLAPLPTDFRTLTPPNFPDGIPPSLSHRYTRGDERHVSVPRGVRSGTLSSPANPAPCRQSFLKTR